MITKIFVILPFLQKAFTIGITHCNLGKILFFFTFFSTIIHSILFLKELFLTLQEEFHLQQHIQKTDLFF